MNKRTIINLITLVITAFLLIFVGRAWYVNNAKVNANNIIGVSATDDFKLELERGKYNSDSSWTWTNVNNLSITSMQPGDVFFFRFKITISKASSFQVSINDVESVLQDTLITRTSVENTSVNPSTTDYYVSLNTTRLYKMDSATVCNLYTKDDKSTHKVLYTYDTTDAVLKLQDYLVETTFRFYNYDLHDADFFDDKDNVLSDDDLEITGEGQTLDNLSVTYDASSITGTVVKYGYFALEFNNEASEVEYVHLDGNFKKDSNPYQGQTLAIKKFVLQEL